MKQKQKKTKIETAKLQDTNSEQSNITLEKVILKEFHSKKYLDKKRKSLGNVIFLLPNGKEY